MLGFLIPSGICFLSDLQYFQNLLMILTIGKFVQSRDRDTDEVLVAYERFLHQERKRSRRFNFEITAHIIVSLVVSIAPPLIAAKSAIGRGDATILISGAAIGGTAIAIAWIVYFRALLKLRR